MYALGQIIKWLGWVVAIVPFAIVIGMSAYIWFANPADQAGCGAGLFVAIMLALFAVPTGLVLVLWIIMHRRTKAPLPGETEH